MTTTEFEQAVTEAAFPEGRNVMATLIQQWTEEGRKEGIKEGHKEGLAEGVEAQRQRFLWE